MTRVFAFSYHFTHEVCQLQVFRISIERRRLQPFVYQHYNSANQMWISAPVSILHHFDLFSSSTR